MHNPVNARECGSVCGPPSPKSSSWRKPTFVTISCISLLANVIAMFSTLAIKRIVVFCAGIRLQQPVEYIAGFILDYLPLGVCFAVQLVFASLLVYVTHRVQSVKLWVSCLLQGSIGILMEVIFTHVFMVVDAQLDAIGLVLVALVGWPVTGMYIFEADGSWPLLIYGFILGVSVSVLMRKSSMGLFRRHL